MAKKEVGARIGACIIYDENLSIDEIVAKIEALHVECYLSPLHTDADKPHYHAVFLFDGQKTRDAFKKLVEGFGVGAEKVNSKGAYLRYLCHLNTADKPTYDVKEVRSLNGAKPYEEAIEDSTSKYVLVGEMVDYISSTRTSFAGLVDYARAYRQDWFRLLVDSNSRLLGEYIRSKCYSEPNPRA